MSRRFHYSDRLEKLAALHDLNALDLLEWWLERSAIREFEGGLPRAEAEKAALADIEAQLS